MDNKEQEKDISSVDCDKNKTRNDYEFLVQKLRSIKETVNSLEKKFLHKEM